MTLAFARATPAPGATIQTLAPRAPDASDRVSRALYDAIGPLAATPTAMSELYCRLGVDGRVACRWLRDSDAPELHAPVTFGADEGAAAVPGVDDAVEIAVTADGLACARRASGRVACWGRNVGGVLTPDRDAPRTMTLGGRTTRSSSATRP